MKHVSRGLSVCLAACLFLGCPGCRPVSDGPTQPSDSPSDDVAHPMMSSSETTERDEDKEEGGLSGFSEIPVTLIRETAVQDRVLVVDQLEQSLERREWGWTYLHGYQDAMDAELLRDIQALELTPETVFFTPLEASESPPEPFYKEYNFISYEGMISAREGERLLEKISPADREEAAGCCLALTKVTMNDYPIYYFRLRLSRSGTDQKGGAA